jgi:hypothetical protein
LPSRADQASRQRRLLTELLDRYRRCLRNLLPLRQLLKGSVYELHTRCGKPSCHCATPEGPLHSTTVLSWSQAGKTRLRSLPPSERSRVRRLAGSYRRFRQARATLVKIHQQILTAIDRLEKALLLSLPPPASRKQKR